ncbi:hypothetical protein F4818DRAFT_251927 [Hypoxylon cercidicola]|nr:hypothetical protein F4818DRAFT_251927 [Hypoxylon cercidicola]
MAMSKRTTFTTISPLPPGITREVVLEFLHSASEMIDLNPLVIERHPISPPSHASPEEQRCAWWSMTDKISYLPGGVVTGDITYTAAFNDLPNGVQTHVYAPMGTDIRERWTLNGNLPGEPPEPVELGIGAPRQGLYLREDVELRCNFVMSSFVKKTLKKAHGTLVERLVQKSKTASAATAPAAQGFANAVAPNHHHHHRATSSVHSSSGAHSNRSSNQFAPYPPAAAAGSQYAPYLQQPRQPQPPRAASGSPLYGHATTTSPPGSSASYGHSHRHSPAPSAASNSNSFVPEPLRVHKPRGSSGQYGQPPNQDRGQRPQQQAQVQNGAWANEKYALDPHAPRQGFAAELEG